MILRQIIRILFQLIPGSEMRHWLIPRNEDRFAPQFVRPDFDVAIDGFPRSANTWIYYQVQLAFPHARVAHHVHSWQQFLFSRLFNVPSVLVVRHPDSSIQSLVTKKGGSLALGYVDYMLTNGLGSALATRVRLFDDLIALQGMLSLFEDIACYTDCTAELVDQIDVQELMARRTDYKNVETPPFRVDDLGKATRMLRSAAHRLYDHIYRSSKA